MSQNLGTEASPRERPGTPEASARAASGMATMVPARAAPRAVLAERG